MTSILSSETITLELPEKESYAFIKANTQTLNSPEYCKTLASAYLKFTPYGQAHQPTDSAEVFSQLYELHQNLVNEVEDYLRQEVPFVYEGQPLQPVLLSFSAYRIAKASQQYMAATLQEKPESDRLALKEKIQSYQAEYEAILQSV